MNSLFNKDTLTVFLILLIIFVTIAYIVTTPKPKEEFIQLEILGKNKLAADYYPTNSTEIPINTEVKWFIRVTNNMNKPIFVLIKFKLGNETTNPPNETTGEPAQMPTITENKYILAIDQIWEIPIIWKIDKIHKINDKFYLTLNFNGKEITVDKVVAKYNFRIVIELWTFKDGKFMFGWETNFEKRYTWLQIWFNVTEKVI